MIYMIIYPWIIIWSIPIYPFLHWLISQYFDDHQEYTQHVKQEEDVNGRDFFKLFQRKYALSLTVSNSSTAAKEPLKILLSWHFLDYLTHWFTQIGVGLVTLPQLGGLNAYTFYTDSIFTSSGKYICIRLLTSFIQRPIITRLSGVSSDLGFISTSIVQVLMI